MADRHAFPLLAAALLAGCLHVIDDALSRPPQSPLVTLGVPALAGLLAVAWRRGVRWRGPALLALGGVWLATGLINHTLPLLARPPLPGDLSGALLSLPAGLTLLWLGLAATLHLTPVSRRR